MGSQLLWYDLLSSQLLLSQSVLDGVRVHGIHTSSSHTTSASTPPLSPQPHTAPRSPTTISSPSRTASAKSPGPTTSELCIETNHPPLPVQQQEDGPRALLVVFGEKRVKVLELWGDASTGVDVLRVLPRFSSWVFDAKLLPLQVCHCNI